MTTTLATLRSAVAGDLRDPAMSTFASAQIDSFINAGIAEVGDVYPVQEIDTINPVALTYSYPTTVEDAFRVEWLRDNAFHYEIPRNEDTSSQGGWELFAGLLSIPKGIADQFDSVRDVLNVWGYRGRARLTADGQVAELDDRAEFAVRAFCRQQAFVLMSLERSIFKQWQAQSNNSDVSESQLGQMVSLYAQEWNRIRNHLRLMRRT